MSKLDAYLRSIEKFGATGAVLTSGQPVTLKFPGGDRNATQVTPHDQLVVLVREVAPPAVLDQIDQQRPVRFEIESQGIRYSLSVSPRPGAWSVAIEPAAAAPPPPPTQPIPRATPVPRAATPAPADDGDMNIERGQYDSPGAAASVVATSGSGFLDQLTTAVRGQRATDVLLISGSPPLVRVNGELAASDRPPVEAEQLSREVGLVAPPEARGAWADNRFATFAYSDGAGRVRVTLGRDQRGPTATFRLLHGDAPPLDRLGLPAEVQGWLGGRGLVVVAGSSGAGKTTTLAALVRALGDRNKSVVAFEDPIEILQSGRSVSQRQIGEHVVSYREGVAAAMLEGADVIVIGAVTTPDAAMAVVEAVTGGHLVLATIVAPGARVAVDRLVDRVDAGHREHARTVLRDGLLGAIAPLPGRGGGRTYEVAGK